MLFDNISLKAVGFAADDADNFCGFFALFFHFGAKKLVLFCVFNKQYLYLPM